MEANPNALGDFKNKEIIEVPPNPHSGKFNECDIIGDFDRDEKGNVIALD